MDFGLINLEVNISFSIDHLQKKIFSLAGRVTNRDNKDAFILNPVKSDLSPWDLFCGYFIAQPSKIHIY